jgi:lipopolysaccharide export system permease protein
VRHFHEHPAMMLVFGIRPSELSFRELQRVVNYYDVEEVPTLRVYVVRYYSLLADTVGPLIIIALAVPFAIAGVRVNPAVGVSKSIGLFLVYFLLVRLSTTLGARDVLDPVWAAVLPNLVMFLLGGWLLVRMR